MYEYESDVVSSNGCSHVHVYVSSVVSMEWKWIRFDVQTQRLYTVSIS